MQPRRQTSLIDLPKRAEDEDLFATEPYAQALATFIRQSRTPITIAIQGEWGSGKTSLMASLRAQLCDGANAQFYPVWLNTWQYSFFSDPETALIKIISVLTNTVGQILKEKYPNRSEIVEKLGRR